MKKAKKAAGKVGDGLLEGLLDEFVTPFILIGLAIAAIFGKLRRKKQ